MLAPGNSARELFERFAADGKVSIGGLSYMSSSLVPACVSREFTILAAGQTSPIAGWLRSLARTAAARPGPSQRLGCLAQTTRGDRPTHVADAEPHAACPAAEP